MLPHEGEADAARSQEGAARDDSAATKLQGSVRRRNAKQELSQRRQVRDDGAATKLQGSIRRRNAKQEVQQRRQARDDAAAEAEAARRAETAASDLKVANREAAQQALRAGERALGAGDLQRAVRLLQKANNLQPDDAEIMAVKAPSRSRASTPSRRASSTA